MSIEAMKQAFEALETYHGYMEPLTTVFGGPRVPAEQSTTGKVERSITSLRQAIAEAEKQEQGEPVAWGVIASNTGRMCQVELEFAEVEDLSPKWVIPLYTTPQQRTWVGLTEDEREYLYCKYHDEAGYAKAGYPDGWDYERAIEAKLKEKNT